MIRAHTQAPWKTSCHHPPQSPSFEVARGKKFPTARERAQVVGAFGPKSAGLGPLAARSSRGKRGDA